MQEKYVVAEGYFMSQNEQDAVIGRVVRELKEANHRINILRTEANNLGQVLTGVGNLLYSKPEALIAQGEGYRPDIMGSGPYILKPDFPTAESITKLTKDIRECLVKLADLERQRVGLGI